MKPPQLVSSSPPKPLALILILTPDGKGVLYVWRDGKHFSTSYGTAHTLREFAARYYPGAEVSEKVIA